MRRSRFRAVVLSGPRAILKMRDAAIARATVLGGKVVREPVEVPGVAFALIADPQGHVVGLAKQLG